LPFFLLLDVGPQLREVECPAPSELRSAGYQATSRLALNVAAIEPKYSFGLFNLTTFFFRQYLTHRQRLTKVCGDVRRCTSRSRNFSKTSAVTTAAADGERLAVRWRSGVRPQITMRSQN